MSQQLLGNCKKGKLFVLSAPAGTGKTTLVHKLVEEFPSVKMSVSCTTRAPRSGEVAGRDYEFLSRELFEEKQKLGEFLESAEVFGHLYGTLKKKVEEELNFGYHLFLVIDTQGALVLQKTGYQAVYIFLTPPSLEVLKERLYKRQTEDATSQELRLSWAEKEIGQAKAYDYVVPNEDLAVAYDILRSIVVAEEYRNHKGAP
ncbi:MAG: guanylate kinase [Chlamydiae bacterium]|nr:guanylate kinase [Chlamydiota bacterium]